MIVASATVAAAATITTINCPLCNTLLSNKPFKRSVQKRESNCCLRQTVHTYLCDGKTRVKLLMMNCSTLLSVSVTKSLMFPSL